MPDFGVHHADPSVHEPDPGVHDAPICVFTMRRSRRSRSADFRIWVTTPKVLVSNTRREASYDTRVIGGNDVMDQLAQLRQKTDGIIGVGGATLATQMLRHGLLDELWLFTHPVVLGSGRALFDQGAGIVECDLLEQTSFVGGVTLHRYAIRR